MRPAAIGLDVLERDPYTFLSYPPTPTLSPTKISIYDDIEDASGSTNNDMENKTSQDSKRKIDGAIIPYCKERVLQTIIDANQQQQNR
ncbi:hypothetical protein INT45_013248 [Circinella minor]|uniref:Uncharacterized protein n=1 Tax=Circinella minor TaxID=1195481 RepID=A0A8H7S2X8_9FUNG|nr:hypothetical protein INT45_013248 [Circinella minor]